MTSNEEQNLECPLCMEPLEMDDINFFPCTCGYQICRFCWHRIRTDENGLCPACRKQYPEDPADFKPLSIEELQKIKTEKKQKDLQRKQKISENRKHLANVRVVQRNLVFVVGLPPRLSDAEALKKHEYFGKFGKIHKVVVNNSSAHAGSQTSHSQGVQSASAYVTYLRAEDALRAIQAVNNIHVDSRTLKASLGTTKYCSHFLKNQQCPKPDCMYLHELGDEEASFTKEEMQHGKHQEYEKKLHDQMLGSTGLTNRKQTPSPVNNQTPKELWPSLQGGGGGKMKGERTLNGLTKHQSDSCGNSSSGDHAKGSGNTAHQSGECRHGTGEETSHKSKKSRERTSEDKQHKGSKEATTHNNNSKHKHISPELQHMGSLDPISAQSLSATRNSSCGSSGGSTDSSAHSSTSSLNCSTEANPISWISSSPSNEPPVVSNCVNLNTPRSLSPSLSSGSPEQSTPYGSLSCGGGGVGLTTASSASPPSPPVTGSTLPRPSWNEQPMGDPMSAYSMNQTAIQFSPFKESFLNGPVNLVHSMQQQQQQHPQTRPPLASSHMIPKLENGFTTPGMMYGMNGISRLQNGDWSRSGVDVSMGDNGTDWQAAFGFGSAQKPQDDDLGFDPWDESSKGLADLLEKEAVKRPAQPSAPFPMQSHLLHQQQQEHLALKQQQLQMLTGSHFSGSAMDQTAAIVAGQQPQRRVAAPPPGFTPNHISSFPPLHRQPFPSEKSFSNSKLVGRHPSFFPPSPSSQEDLLSSQLRPGLASHLRQPPQNCIPLHLRPKQQLSEGYGSDMKDWQNGLRSMLPSISISFGSSPSSQQTVGAHPCAAASLKSNLWNGPSPDLSWSSQDATALSTVSVSDNAGRESPPHWMQSLHQLTLEDGTVAYGNHHVPHSPLFAYRDL